MHKEKNIEAEIEEVSKLETFEKKKQYLLKNYNIPFNNEKFPNEKIPKWLLEKFESDNDLIGLTIMGLLTPEVISQLRANPICSDENRSVLLTQQGLEAMAAGMFTLEEVCPYNSQLKAFLKAYETYKFEPNLIRLHQLTGMHKFVRERLLTSDGLEALKAKVFSVDELNNERLREYDSKLSKFLELFLKAYKEYSFVPGLINFTDVFNVYLYQSRYPLAYDNKELPSKVTSFLKMYKDERFNPDLLTLHQFEKMNRLVQAYLGMYKINGISALKDGMFTVDDLMSLKYPFVLEFFWSRMSLIKECEEYDVKYEQINLCNLDGINYWVVDQLLTPLGLKALAAEMFTLDDLKLLKDSDVLRVFLEAHKKHSFESGVIHLPQLDGLKIGFLEALLTPDGIKALKEKMFTVDEVKLLSDPNVLGLFLKRYREVSMKPGLISLAQVNNMGSQYRDELLTPDGVKLLTDKVLIPEEVVKQLQEWPSPLKQFYSLYKTYSFEPGLIVLSDLNVIGYKVCEALLSEKGRKALQAGVLTVDEVRSCTSCNLDDRVIRFLNLYEKYSFEPGVISLSQIAEIEYVRSYQVLLSKEGLFAFKKGLEISEIKHLNSRQLEEVIKKKTSCESDLEMGDEDYSRSDFGIF